MPSFSPCLPCLPWPRLPCVSTCISWPQLACLLPDCLAWRGLSACLAWPGLACLPAFQPTLSGLSSPACPHVTCLVWPDLASPRMPDWLPVSSGLSSPQLGCLPFLSSLLLPFLPSPRHAYLGLTSRHIPPCLPFLASPCHACLRALPGLASIRLAC